MITRLANKHKSTQEIDKKWKAVNDWPAKTVSIASPDFSQALKGKVIYPFSGGDIVTFYKCVLHLVVKRIYLIRLL